jgi:hypothetical protein
MRRPTLAIPLSAIALAMLAGCGSSSDEWIKLDAQASQARCTELATSAGLAATTLTTAYVADGTKRPGTLTTGDFLPGHCVITGSIGARTGVDGKPYATGFQLSLPDNWNGRFLYLGGGGNDGTLRDTSLSSSISVGTPSPLGQGYAVVSTDAGRQGMMFSQRFPSYFDGITAGAPAMRVSSGATVAAMWNNKKFTDIAPQDGSGNRILSQAFSNGDLNLVAGAIANACDAADGAVDGLVANTTACTFDPVVLQCAGAKTDSCITPAQVGALKDVFGGPKNSAGQQLYAGQPWDPGIRDAGWRAWTLGTSTTAVPNSRYNVLMLDALRNEFFTPPEPGFDALAFNFDIDPARMEAFSAVYDTYRDTQMAAFKARGGKMLFIHGMADPIFSATDTVDYYEKLAANNGGIAATQSFARTFLVPGMAHCSGGPATDTYDSLQAMVDWVEKGVAPDTIAARATATNAYYPNRTRPLCPYPKFAKYKGTGSIEDAANFSCSES